MFGGASDSMDVSSIRPASVEGDPLFVLPHVGLFYKPGDSTGPARYAAFFDSTEVLFPSETLDGSLDIASLPPLEQVNDDRLPSNSSAS